MPSVLVLDKEADSLMQARESPFSDERVLQEALMAHPEFLPIPHTRRLVSLAREYSSALRIDLLCVDSEGRLYLVETKLQRNTDRRQAVAQIQEYAARLRDEKFSAFEGNVAKRRGNRLPAIVEQAFGDEARTVLDGLRRSLDYGDFTLVIVMDQFDEPIRKSIVYLRQKSKLDILGVEVHKYNMDAAKDIFIFDVIGTEVQPERETAARPTIDMDRTYLDKGLSSELAAVKGAFAKAEEQYSGFVWIEEKRTELQLKIGEKICISIHRNPEEQHGVWVSDPALYPDVIQAGRQLGFLTKTPATESGKPILFNGAEGIRKFSRKAGEVIEKLVEVYKAAT